jgi:hypothetical protein
VTAPALQRTASQVLRDALRPGHIICVMRGLDPPAGPKPLRDGESPHIHPSSLKRFSNKMDCRIKPGTDES